MKKRLNGISSIASWMSHYNSKMGFECDSSRVVTRLTETAALRNGRKTKMQLLSWPSLIIVRDSELLI